MPVKDCQRLADLVLHSRSADGHLELQGKVFKGYDRYPYIDDDEVDGEVQQRVTTQLVKSGAEFNHIKFWLKHCEAFRKVVQRMADLLGVSVARLKQAHFIRQQSRQCANSRGTRTTMTCASPSPWLLWSSAWPVGALVSRCGASDPSPTPVWAVVSRLRVPPPTALCTRSWEVTARTQRW